MLLYHKVLITYCSYSYGFGNALFSQVQEAALRSLPDIVVATPGRIIDHLRNSLSVGLEDLAVLILDEADRLLELGFSAEIQELVFSLLLFLAVVVTTAKTSLLFNKLLGFVNIINNNNVTVRSKMYGVGGMDLIMPLSCIKGIITTILISIRSFLLVLIIEVFLGLLYLSLCC